MYMLYHWSFFHKVSKQCFYSLLHDCLLPKNHLALRTITLLRKRLHTGIPSSLFRTAAPGSTSKATHALGTSRCPIVRFVYSGPRSGKVQEGSLVLFNDKSYWPFPKVINIPYHFMTLVRWEPSDLLPCHTSVYSIRAVPS